MVISNTPNRASAKLKPVAVRKTSIIITEYVDIKTRRIYFYTTYSFNILFVISYVSVAFPGPLAAALVARYAFRGVVMAGGALVCAGCIASAYAPNITLLFLSYGVLLGYYITR